MPTIPPGASITHEARGSTGAADFEVSGNEKMQRVLLSGVTGGDARLTVGGSNQKDSAAQKWVRWLAFPVGRFSISVYPARAPLSRPTTSPCAVRDIPALWRGQRRCARRGVRAAERRERVCAVPDRRGARDRSASAHVACSDWASTAPLSARLYPGPPALRSRRAPRSFGGAVAGACFSRTSPASTASRAR